MEYEIQIGGIDNATCGMYALESEPRKPLICFGHWESFSRGFFWFFPGTGCTPWHFVYEPEVPTLQILNHELMHWLIHKLEGYPVEPENISSDMLDRLIRFVGNEDQLGLPIREGESDTQ